MPILEESVNKYNHKLVYVYNCLKKFKEINNDYPYIPQIVEITKMVRTTIKDPRNSIGVEISIKFITTENYICIIQTLNDSINGHSTFTNYVNNLYYFDNIEKLCQTSVCMGDTNLKDRCGSILDMITIGI